MFGLEEVVVSHPNIIMGESAIGWRVLKGVGHLNGVCMGLLTHIAVLILSFFFYASLQSSMLPTDPTQIAEVPSRALASTEQETLEQYPFLIRARI